MSEPRKKIEKEELAELLKLIQEAYKEAGKKITTATLYQGDEEELVIDNREDKDIN